VKKDTNGENYVTLKIPKALADEIDHVIEKGMLGYRSRAELASDAIRRRIEQLRSNNSTENTTVNNSGKE
jgi:metal-responsive CopG/Arc/MetJ family transcriptional regulator